VATPGGTQDFDVSAETSVSVEPDATSPAASEPSEMWEALEQEPFRFNFFQAVRLLERLMPERERVGRFVQPSREVVHFGANPSISFPPSQLY